MGEWNECNLETQLSVADRMNFNSMKEWCTSGFFPTGGGGVESPLPPAENYPLLPPTPYHYLENSAHVATEIDDIVS